MSWDWLERWLLVADEPEPEPVGSSAIADYKERRRQLAAKIKELQRWDYWEAHVESAGEKRRHIAEALRRLDQA